MTEDEIVVLLENFLDTNPGEWKWDDFIPEIQADPDFEHFLALCIYLYEYYPSTKPEQPCNKKGVEIIRELIGKIRNINSKQVTMEKVHPLKIGSTFYTDSEGYLVDPSEWSIQNTEFMAREEKCNLTEEHWIVINYLREYYEANRLAPSYKIFYKEMGKRLGKKKDIEKYVDNLFPNKVGIQASRYAGLLKSRGHTGY